MNSLIKKVVDLPNVIKKLIIVFIDIFCAILSVYLSYVLRFDDLNFYLSRDIQYLVHYSDFLFIVLFFIPFLVFTRFYQGSSRYFDSIFYIFFSLCSFNTYI